MYEIQIGIFATPIWVQIGRNCYQLGNIRLDLAPNWGQKFHGQPNKFLGCQFFCPQSTSSINLIDFSFFAFPCKYKSSFRVIQFFIAISHKLEISYSHTAPVRLTPIINSLLFAMHNGCYYPQFAHFPFEHLVPPNSNMIQVSLKLQTPYCI